MTFQIGEKVVYPNQGVGTVENISTRSFGSALEKFYLLRFGYNSMTVLVPFSNAAHIGLRRVTKDREISRVLAYLANGSCALNGDWKARYKENARKMQSGDLLKAAEVFKSLLQLQVEKALSLARKENVGVRPAHARLGNIHFAESAGVARLRRPATGAGQSRSRSATNLLMPRAPPAAASALPTAPPPDGMIPRCKPFPV